MQQTVLSSVAGTMRFLPLLLGAMRGVTEIGYSATVSMEVTISPAFILDKNSHQLFVGDAVTAILRFSVKVADAVTATLSPPDDVDITSVNLHDTAPGVIRLIASTTSASSTAILAQSFSGLTIESITSVVRSLVPEEYASSANLISIVSISKPLTVINYLPPSPPSPPPQPPSPSPLPPSPLPPPGCGRATGVSVCPTAPVVCGEAGACPSEAAGLKDRMELHEVRLAHPSDRARA